MRWMYKMDDILQPLEATYYDNMIEESKGVGLKPQLPFPVKTIKRSVPM